MMEHLSNGLCQVLVLEPWPHFVIYLTDTKGEREREREREACMVVVNRCTTNVARSSHAIPSGVIDFLPITPPEFCP